MKKQYLNAGEAAALLGTSRVTLRRLIVEGKLPTEQDPLDRRKIMIPVSAIEQLRRTSEKYGGGRSGPKAQRVA